VADSAPVSGPLERALIDLARSLDTGPVPDVAPAVLARLRGRPERRIGVRLRAVLVAIAVSLLLALLPGVRTAVAEFVRGLPGVVFSTEREQPGELPPPRRLGESLALTQAVPLDEARSQVAFPVLVPEAFGPPDEVYVRGPHAVTLLWRARPGLPALDGSHIGAVADVIAPSVGAWLEKRLHGVGVERLLVDGHEAMWIGQAHPLLLLDQYGQPVEQRLAARTLLIYHSGVTVRIESLLSREQAVAAARSLR
jgi:hypothetical protein